MDKNHSDHRQKGRANEWKQPNARALADLRASARSLYSEFKFMRIL